MPVAIGRPDDIIPGASITVSGWGYTASKVSEDLLDFGLIKLFLTGTAWPI